MQRGSAGLPELASSERTPQTGAGDINHHLKMPKLRRQTLGTTIIEGYRH
jgi:hypothetical protein